MTQRKPDISRAKELLGWEPEIPLKMGLQPTVAWFRHQLGMDDGDVIALRG